MGDYADTRQGTPALMTLKTLEAPGPPHGYGVARRGQPAEEAREWEQAAAIPARLFAPLEES